MMDTFADMLTREWQATPGGYESAWLAILMSLLLGQVIGWVYIRTHVGLSYSRSFAASLVVLPPIVALVMMVMIDNIVVAFGLFAVFAIVRFRNIVKDTRDTSFVLWTIVTGLSAGTFRFSLALTGCIALAAIYFYLHLVGFGSRSRFDSMLSLLWQDGRASLDRLDGVLRRHANAVTLASQRRAGDDALRLTYHLQMRDPNRGADMLAELAIVQAELARQHAAVKAASRELELDRTDRARSQALTLQRLRIEVDERRLDALDRRAALAADRLELQRLDLELEQLAALVERAAETDYRRRTAELRRDALKHRIEGDELALAVADDEVDAARNRLATLPPAPSEPLDDDDLTVLLSPLSAELDVVARRLDALRATMERLEIRAPIAGTITAVHRRGGEVALPGEPIVTITDSIAIRVIAYLPEPGPFAVDVGQSVLLRADGARRRTVESRVVAVGPRVDLIPLEQRRTDAPADRPLFGLPFVVELPPASGLLPGERVEVRLLDNARPAG